MSEEGSEEEFIVEEVKEDSTTSTVIICILAHGMDLCSQKLPDYGDKLKNTLIFSMANRGGVSLDFNKNPNVDKVLDLYTKFHENKERVFDIINDLDIRSRPDSKDEKYNIFDCIDYNSSEFDLKNSKIDDKIKQINEKISKHPDNNTVKQQRNKEIDFWIKHKQQLEKEEIYKIAQHTNCKNSYGMGYNAKPRFIENDRLYDIENTLGSEWQKPGIYMIDVRNPKSETQNGIMQLQAELNNNKNVKLSEILEICYIKYNFDYVTIIDFGCRVYDNDTTSSAENTCITCQISTDELEKGKNVMDTYNRLKLGGKKRKTNKRKTNKRKTNKRKTNKK